MALAPIPATPLLASEEEGIGIDPILFATLIYEHNSKPLGGDPFFIIDSKSGEVIVNFIGSTPILSTHSETEKLKIIEENLKNAERQFYADMIRDGFTIIGGDAKEYKPDARFKSSSTNAKDTKVQDDFKKNISIKMLTALGSSSERLIAAISHFYSQALHNAIPGFYCTTKIGRKDAAFVPTVPSGGSWLSLRKKGTQFVLQFDYRYNNFSIDIPGTIGANCPAHLGLKVTLEFGISADPRSPPPPCKLASVELFGADAPIFEALIAGRISHAEIIKALIERKAFIDEIKSTHKPAASVTTPTTPASHASEASTARLSTTSSSSLTNGGAGCDSASSLTTLLAAEIKPSSPGGVLNEFPLGLFSPSLIIGATPLFFKLMQNKKMPPAEAMLICSIFLKRLDITSHASFLAYVQAQQEISTQVFKLSLAKPPTTTADSTAAIKTELPTASSDSAVATEKPPGIITDPLIEAAAFWSVIRTACSSALDELGLVKR